MDGVAPKSKKIRDIMNAFKSRLDYNELPLRVIMYKCNTIYEYNPYKHEIRPFNSLMWYNLDKVDEDVYDFIIYIDNKYNRLIENDLDVSTIGTIYNGILSINLDVLNEVIIPKESGFSKNAKMNLVFSFNNFINYANSLYSMWEKVLSKDFDLNND